MIRGMAGMTPTMGPAPDPSRTGYTDRQRAAFGLPFFVRFCPAQAGILGGKRLCRTLACPDFCLRQGADRPGKQRERSQEKIF